MSKRFLCATRAEFRPRGLQVAAAAVCAAPIADTGDVGLEKTSRTPRSCTRPLGDSQGTRTPIGYEHPFKAHAHHNLKQSASTRQALQGTRTRAPLRGFQGLHVPLSGTYMHPCNTYIRLYCNTHPVQGRSYRMAPPLPGKGLPTPTAAMTDAANAKTVLGASVTGLASCPSQPDNGRLRWERVKCCTCSAADDAANLTNRACAYRAR